MLSRTDAAALVGAAAVLLVAAWFDTSVVADAQRQVAATFEPRGAAALESIGAVMVGGACLSVGWLGARSGPLVGLPYIVVGGFFAFLPWLTWTFAAQINDAQPILPDPIAQAMGDLYYRTQQGPLDAVAVIGGAMLLGGIVSLARFARRQGDAAASPPLIEPTG